MRLLLQRVTKAKVTSLNEIAEIKDGLLVFVGFHILDDSAILDKMVHKFFNIYYFTKGKEKAKFTIEERQCELLIVSQFTLFADLKKGKNPSWHKAASPVIAKKLYDLFCQKVCERYSKIKTGDFGAFMKVELVNDGPFTILLDSDELFLKKN